MEVELDDRMTDETRNYVINFFKISKPTDLLKADLRLIRKIKDDASLALSQIHKFDDLNISEITVKNKYDNHEILVTKYVPINMRKDAHVTVFFHGGGYCLGSRMTHHHTVGLLARSSGSIWLSVEYRRCPDEAKYPTPYLDCKSVVEWALENKSTLADENSKLGMCGDSAGGTMAAILAHELKQNIDYQILIYPTVLFSDEYESFKQFQKDCYILVPPVIEFFAKNLTDVPLEHAPHLSPILYPDFTGLPKCVLIAVELDPLVDHSKHYYDKLTKTQNECKLSIIKGTIHGYFSQPFVFKQAFAETQDLIVQFLKNL